MSNVLGILRQPLTHEWATPSGFFQTLNEEFHFELDAAASSSNALCLAYYDEQMDGLTSEWYPAYSSVWCNPPYGTQIGKWVAKGFSESQHGAVVVMLIPARTDTRWWHQFVMRAAEVQFVCGRLCFGRSKTNAPFPSTVVVFRKEVTAPRFSSIDRQGHPISARRELL